MSQSTRVYDLVLFGATGYTGRITAEWITSRLPTTLRWAIAGRDTSKLEAIALQLKQLDPNRKLPNIEIVTLDKEELLRLARKTRLLITTVGPFMHYGEPVLAACAQSGTHYLDSSGEVPWIYDMIAKYHDLAVRNGAIIIPACGLDSVPADMMAFALTRSIRQRFGTGTRSVTMSLFDVKSGFSGGTMHTMVDLFSYYGAAKLQSRMKPFSLSPVTPAHGSTTPAPKATLQHRMLGLIDLPELGGLQTMYIMATVDQCITHRSWGLYESTSSSSRTGGRSSYGPSFRFTQHLRAPARSPILIGTVMSLGISAFAILLSFPPTRFILTPLLKTFFLPALGSGPSRESMKDDFFSYRAVAVANSPGDEEAKKVRGRLDVKQGGYGITGLTLSAAAEVMLQRLEGKVQLGQVVDEMSGGVLTPACLGNAFLDKLREFGMMIETHV